MEMYRRSVIKWIVDNNTHDSSVEGGGLRRIQEWLRGAHQ